MPFTLKRCGFFKPFTLAMILALAVIMAQTANAATESKEQKLNNKIAALVKQDDWQEISLYYGVYTSGLKIFNAKAVIKRNIIDSENIAVVVETYGRSSKWLEIMTFGKIRFDFDLYWRAKFIKNNSQEKQRIFVPELFKNSGNYGSGKKVFWSNQITFDDNGNIIDHIYETDNNSYTQQDDWVPVTEEDINSSTDPMTPFMNLLINVEPTVAETCKAKEPEVVFAGSTISEFSFRAIKDAFVNITPATAVGGEGAICTFDVKAISGYRKSWHRSARSYARDLYFVSISEDIPPLLVRAKAETKYFDIFANLSSISVVTKKGETIEVASKDSVEKSFACFWC